MRQFIKHPDVWTFAFLLGIGVLLWVIAYQRSPSFHLFIGGNTTTHRREYDAPFIQGFHASEPFDDDIWQWWTLDPGYAYRWTRPDASIDLPGPGGRQWIVSLDAASGRPDSSATTSTWQVGEQTLLPLTIAAAPRTYHVLGQTSSNGNLRIQMTTPPYRPTDDPRDLGFVLRGVHIAPLKATLYPPALAQVGWMAAVVTLFYSLARWLSLPRRAASYITLAVALLLAVLLSTHRLVLAAFTPTLTLLLLVCWLLALLLVGVVRSGAQYARVLHLTASYIKPLVALVVLAFALRLGGMLHPYAIFSDHLMNANNLLELGLGRVYFTEGLPKEAGGGQAPYPPGTYLMAAPLQLLAPTDIAARALVVQSSVALLDSLLLVLLWLALWLARMGPRAALYGAALYLAPAPIMTSFSIGEYANIGGQALALPALLLLARFPIPGREGGRSFALSPLLALLLTVALLGHMGVTLSLVLVLAAMWLLLAGGYLVQRATEGASAGQERLSALARFTLSAGAAGAVAGLVYYSAPPFLAIVSHRMAGHAAADTAPTTAPWEPLLRSIGGVFLPTSTLLPLLFLCGGMGLVVLWQRRNDSDSRGLYRLLLAWFLGILFSFGLLLLARQGVRWQHFLFPALCLGAAPLLAAWHQRGRAGSVVAWAGVLLPIGHGVAVWITHIQRYLH